MSEEGAADWERMYNELTDPEEIEKAQQEAQRKKIKEDKKTDTGL